MVAGPAPSAFAVQATGDDVAAWATGQSWTYNPTSFNYNDGQGTNVTITESVTYTVQGTTTFNGQSAYQLGISGTITGGSGTANASGTSATLDGFSGTVSGSEIVRRSDLALLQEVQHQSLSATAHVSIVSVGITASFDLTLSPTPGWRTLDFPLNNGDSWHESSDVAYTGAFTYNAGSFGSGSSPFDGDFDFSGSASTASPVSMSEPIGTRSTDRVLASSSDGTATDNQWWSPNDHNLAEEHLVAPLGGATVTMDRHLSSESIGSPANTISETVTPSLSCAGGLVTVAGTLSTHASGVPITATVDKSPGGFASQVVSTTTGSGGAYSATVSAPTESDGASKNGSRANWGVVVDAGGGTNASNAATLVVTAQDCSELHYNGDTSGPTGGTASVSATLVDDASPSGAAGKQVTFSLGGSGSVNATTNASGVAVANLPITGAPRSTSITVSFAGTSGIVGSSDSKAFTVTQAPTSTTVVESASSVTIGDSVTFTATVTPGVGSGETGTVQFLVDGNNFGAPAPLVGGQASSAPLDTSTIGLGDHPVTAVYSGDTNFAGSTAPAINLHVHKVLAPTTTTLTAAPTTSVFGQQVALTATVAPQSGPGDPTGTITFNDGSTVLGAATVTNSGGVDGAELDTSDLTVGSHNITATYSGDDDFNTSTSLPVTVTVAKAGTTTTVQASDANTVSGEGVTYTATVTATAPGGGQPDGTAQLKIDGTNEGDPVTLSGGTAVFPTVSSLGAGDHTISVVYSGSDNFNGSTGTTTQHVVKADTTTFLSAAPSPASEGADVIFTATVSAQAPGSGEPTGNVVFTIDGSPAGAAALADNGGTAQATLDDPALAAGDHLVSATYQGDGNYKSSDSDQITETVVSGAAVQATTTSLTSSVNPSVFGQLVTFTATVANAADPDGNTPVGAVQFAVDGTNIGGPVSLDANGVAQSLTLASPPPGDHFVTATYQPNAEFSSSGASLTQTVSDADVQVNLTSSNPNSNYGQSVSFHATVNSLQAGTGTPTGQVQFRIDGTALGHPVDLSGGAADSPAISNLTPGDHTVTVLYTGSVDFLAESATITQTVHKIGTTTALTSSPNPSGFGQNVTFTATVTPATTALGAPDGSVQFTEGTTVLATVPVAASGNVGVATFTTHALSAGTHAVKASYGSSDSFVSSTSNTVSQVVTKATTSISADPAVLKLVPLGLPLGTLRATLTSGGAPLAGKTLVFKIGTLTACTATTNSAGQATCSALAYILNLTLNLGYTVSFAGDANYQGSTGAGGLLG